MLTVIGNPIGFASVIISVNLSSLRSPVEKLVYNNHARICGIFEDGEVDGASSGVSRFLGNIVLLVVVVRATPKDCA